jgi:hypothetical protein
VANKYIVEGELHSVTQLIDRKSFNDPDMDGFFDDDHFFGYRGQTNPDNSLIPAMFRDLSPDIDREKVLEIERDIYRDFLDRGRVYLAEEFKTENQWELLCFAQHYGVPTRLLDWTTSPLVGLYFATVNLMPQVGERSDAVLWCMNVSLTLNPKTGTDHSYMRAVRASTLPNNLHLFSEHPGDEEAPQAMEEQYPFAVLQAPDISYRIKNQWGLFSVSTANCPEFFDQSKDFEKLYEINCGYNIDRPLLLKLLIPQDYKLKIREELDHIGITPDRIFPDLDGLGMYLKYWRNKRVQISK